MVVVAARIKAKAGAAEELAGRFHDMVEWVRANEPETLTYACNRSTDDPDRFLFFERYTSKNAFREHTSSERFLAFAAGLQGLVDGPIEIDTYEEIAAKL
jgi:quinol monooxygenase YgiN